MFQVETLAEDPAIHVSAEKRPVNHRPNDNRNEYSPEDVLKLQGELGRWRLAPLPSAHW